MNAERLRGDQAPPRNANVQSAGSNGTNHGKRTRSNSDMNLSMLWRQFGDFASPEAFKKNDDRYDETVGLMWFETKNFRTSVKVPS